MLSMITGFVGGIKGKIALAVIAFAVLSSLYLGFLGMRNGYVNAKEESAAYKNKLSEAHAVLNQMETNSAEQAELLMDQEEQHNKDIIDLQTRFDKKIAVTQILNDNVSKIKVIERPQNDKDCPVHPAIVASFSILRERDTAAANNDN